MSSVGVDRRVLCLLPVLEAQFGDPFKFAAVVRDQDQLPSKGLAGDQHIVRANGCAGASESGAQVPGLARILAIEFDDFKGQRIDLPQRLLGSLAFKQGDDGAAIEQVLHLRKSSAVSLLLGRLLSNSAFELRIKRTDGFLEPRPVLRNGLEDDRPATTANADLISVEPKVLWQPHRLEATGPKDLGGFHELPP